MKSLFLSAFVFFFALAATAQKTIYDANAEQRTVTSFHAVHISNAIDVFISQGNEENLAVSAANKSDLEHIKTKVENGVLKIWFEENKKWWGSNKKLKAYIAVKNLDELHVSGACDVKI